MHFDRLGFPIFQFHVGMSTQIGRPIITGVTLRPFLIISSSTSGSYFLFIYFLFFYIQKNLSASVEECARGVVKCVKKSSGMMERLCGRISRALHLRWRQARRAGRRRVPPQFVVSPHSSECRLLEVRLPKPLVIVTSTCVS